MTRLNSAVTPESLQAMKTGGEMNLAQQKLNQDAAARNQQAQIANAKLQMDREAQDQSMAMGVANMDMQRARMQQQAQLSADRLAFDKEAQDYNRNFQREQFAEETRRYEEGKELEAKALKRSQDLEIARIQMKISIAEKGFEASQAEIQKLNDLADERDDLMARITAAEADQKGEREKFDQALPGSVKKIADQLSGGQEISTRALINVGAQTDATNFFMNVETYGGQEAPIGGAVTDTTQYINPYAGFGIVGAVTGALDSRDAAIMGAIGEDTPATNLFDVGEDPTEEYIVETDFGKHISVANPYQTKNITDLGLRLERRYAEQIANSLITNDQKKSALFTEHLVEAFKSASEMSNMSSKEKAEGAQGIIGRLNNAATQFGINPVVLGDVLNGIKKDASARTNAYLAGGWHTKKLVDIDPDEMVNASGGTDGNLSRSLEHLVGSRWFNQGNIAGILALGSAATTTEETLVSLNKLSGETKQFGVEEFINIIGDRGFIDENNDGIIQKGEGLGGLMDMAQGLVGGKDDLEALEEQMDAFKTRESRGVGRAEVESASAEQKAQIEELTKLLDTLRGMD